MRYVIALVAILPFVAVGIGMLTGRVRARSCCSVAPDRDHRLQGPGSTD